MRQDIVTRQSGWKRQVVLHGWKTSVSEAAGAGGTIYRKSLRCSHQWCWTLSVLLGLSRVVTISWPITIPASKVVKGS